jgi:sugar phosphate isomerase/epimerase
MIVSAVEKSNQRETPMTSTPRLLFSTGSLYVYDLSLAFQLSAEAGFDGVEVMCDERYSTRHREYLQQLSDQHNQPIHVLHTPFSPRLPGWYNAQHDQIERITQTLKLAEKLNAESIVVHLPDKRSMATISFNDRSFRIPWRKVTLNPVKDWMENQLAAVQKKTSVKIAIENMPAKKVAGQLIEKVWWNDIESWSQVHEWLTLDTTHWATKRVNPLDAYRAAKGRVCHVHLSNYNGREHRLPQKGNLNLRTFLNVLAEDQYAGTISVELHPGVLEFSNLRKVRQNMVETHDFCRSSLS